MEARGLRLLWVNTVSTGRNGQTMFLLKYLRAMDRSNMEIGYVGCGAVDSEIRREIEAMGVRFYSLSMRNRHPLRYMGRLKRVIREGRYEIVHAHGNSSTLFWEMLAAKSCGVPVRIAHSHNTRCAHIILHRLLNRPMLGALTHAMACGEAAGRWLFGARPFEVVRNASDLEEFRFRREARDAQRERMKLEDRIAIGCVAGFNAQKNHAFLLRAFADALKREPRLHLVLMGDGALRAEIEALIDSLGIRQRVTLTGAVPDVGLRLQAMDAMALPSLYEGFPNVLVEWQIAGLPALVSDRVSRECAMTALLRFLPLDERVWSDALVAIRPIDRQRASADGAARVVERGYDVRVEAARLKARYVQMRSEAGRCGD